ncbi:hypothetical protein [Arthrobacter nitrophenolicus]|uniref:hypothetical protein n=1 Tax=Arthrobacter nitrophenolicus TaxID=683150 RepID=UPI0030B81B18
METPTAGRPAGDGRRRAVLAAALVTVLLSGCSLDVRDPAAPEAAESPTVPATPTITPGHDAEAVAAQDLPFSAGGILARGVPVGISDGLREAPAGRSSRKTWRGKAST